MKNKNWLGWALVVLVAAVIFALSAQPHSSEFTARILGSHNGVVRKIAHFTEFAILFLVLRYAASTIKWFRGGRLNLVPLVLVVLAALTDEWHQSFVPGRTPSMIDVLIDTSGAVFALVLCQIRIWARRWF